nr:hypothetical protein [Tanacetum cinerariifolium]
MKHYLEHTDYHIWEVIQKGNGLVQVSIDTHRQIRVLLPKTAEEILATERERKARTTLLMVILEDHLAKFQKMTDAKEMWVAIKSGFGGNEGLHKGYDRFQSLLSQLETHGAGISIEDANQKFIRSLPSSWSQVSLIMRIKPGLDTLNFDNLYNNLKIFEYDVKGSTGSPSSIQNMAFVSSHNSSSTNEVNTANGVSTSLGHNSQKEGSSSYTDDLMYFFFSNQSSGPQLNHEDLEQVDKFDLEEMDLKWQVAMISTRLKKFYKNTGRKLHFDAKEPVGFDKSKVECFSSNNTRHFSRECRSKGNQDSKRRDARNTRYKARDNRKRPVKQDEHKAMVTVDGEGIDWTGHDEDETEDYALMDFNSSNSGSDTKDKSGLGYGSQIHDGVLSYKNEVFASVFESRSSDVEDSPVNDRFAKVEGMHAVPPSMKGNYMPHKSNFRIDESKFTYGSKQSTTSESQAKTSDLDSCDSNSSVETLESVPKPVANKPKVVSEPKVWSDAPIIEEYESDSDDEHVNIPSKEQEKPSFAFVNTIEHAKIIGKILKNKTHVACFVCGSFRHLIRDCDFHEERMAKQIVLNKQKASTSSARKVNTARPKVNEIRPRHNVYKSHSPIGRSFNRTIAPKENFAQHKVNTAEDKVVSVVGGKWKTAVKASAGNKAYLADYQDFNGGLVAFGGSKGQITSKGNSDMEADHAQEYYVLPLWFSYTSTVNSSKAKNEDEKLNEDTDLKSHEKPVDQEDQDFLEELKRLKRQEKDANDAAETLKRRLLKIPSLEDIYEVSKDRIFTSASYDDEGAMANFINLETTMNIHRQEEGIDYNEVFAPVARIEAIRIFLAFTFYMGFIVYQMDVKSAFLYGKISKEVYVSQPPGFIDPKFPNKVYKVVKAFGYRRGLIDKTLFIKKDKKDIMLVQVYVDDIIFGPTKKSWCDEFEDLLKKSVKTASTPIETKKALVKDEEAADVDFMLRFQVISKTSHLQAVKRIFRRLISWQCKKQTIVATSTTDAEDAYEKKLILVLKIHTNDNVADLLTKSFDVSSLLKVSIANLEFVAQHNMVACLEKTEGNSEFHEIVDFFTSSTIHHALTVQSPHDSPPSGGRTSDRAEGALNLEELFSICTNLSNMVLAFETVKDAKAAEIIALKARIKKLEKSTLDDLDADHGIDTKEPMNQGRLSEETKELVSTTRPEIVLLGQMVSIKDIKDSSRPARLILTLKPLPTIDLKDKDKGVLEDPEPAKKMTKSDLDAAQISKDVEVARLVYKEELAELEMEKEKRQREEEASKAAIAEMYDKVQAGIEADALAAQRSAEIRSRPPTKTQLRNLMVTYLKNRGGYNYSQLKEKTFIEIQGLYERQKRVIDDFKPMDSDDAVEKEKVLEEPNNTKIEVKQEGNKENIRKRPRKRINMKATKKSKRKKIDSDLKKEEHLKTFLQIVPDEEGEVDYEVLDKRFPIINWESKLCHLDRHGVECIYYRIFRSDGSSRWIKTFSEMVTRFDRMYLEELYNLVMQSKELAYTKQTALGKDISNPLIVDSLLKTIWLSVHHIVTIKHWLFQSKRLLDVRKLKVKGDIGVFVGYSKESAAFRIYNKQTRLGVLDCCVFSGENSGDVTEVGEKRMAGKVEMLRKWGRNEEVVAVLCSCARVSGSGEWWCGGGVEVVGSVVVVLEPLENTFGCNFFMKRGTSPSTGWFSWSFNDTKGSSSTPFYSPGSSTPPHYSPGSSTTQSYSLGTSRNAECSNCKHLHGKIPVLEATVYMYMHPEQHKVNSATLFHEVYNNMGKLDLE